MAATLQQARDIAYSILREEQDSTAYPLVFMDQLLNSAQLRIFSGKLMDRFKNTAIRATKLPFTDKDQFYSNVWQASVAENVTPGQTTLTVSANLGYPDSWALYINGNIVTYTGKTDTSFTWIPATGEGSLQFTFEPGANIYRAFELPSDFMSAITVTYNHNFKLRPKNYDDLFEDLNSYKVNYAYTNNNNTYSYNDFLFIRPFYTLVDGKYLVPFQLNNPGDMIHLRYTAKPARMTNATDNLSIPDDDFALSTVPYVAVGEMLFNRWEESRAAELLTFAYWQVAEMYNFYNNQMFEDPSWTQYKTWKWKRLNI